MKLHAALARALAGHGVDTMFGLIGDANMFLVHSFVHDMDRRYVGAAHESAAMFMGVGYAGPSGRLAVVTVTHGPALTNTVTGLIAAVRGRIPLLVIAGDTATGSRTNIQDIAQRDVVLPSGAGFEQARSPHSALHDLAVAIGRALVERRPIVLNIPCDFMDEEVPYADVALNLPAAQTPYPDPGAIRHAASRIATAHRPIVIAGRAAIAARPSLLAFAERIGAPVATTLTAKDLFRDEPFDLGIAGGPAEAAARQAVEDSDLVVAFGTDGEALTAGRRVVVVDTHLSAWPWTVDAEVRGDAAVVAEALMDELDERGAAPSGHRSAALVWRLAGRPPLPPGAIVTALRQLDEILPQDRVLVSDGGRLMAEPLRHLRVIDPRAFVFPESFGSAGTGMGAAIGAAAACKPHPVVLICSGEGFLHGGLAEFATAAREHLDVIVVVCDNDGHGADLATLAEALGGDGITVRGLDDLPAVEKLVTSRTRPLLIDLRLED
ncbi:thiamine pyrophosphate-dependent acetolactate synthase large subunit-like protein [Actinoplanes lutulentus]|uniref:Thiamine pyrophosphate-dependent acetolactate synthase large subunit-like protein n=1 Tax=Actinoplanes lutulentus TaxID=1287878 RepID=A0A327ZIU9_9ACTN|nr:thiamine pyrophosphate-binding protein [Actinoplanes lutulentus]MBB2940575.1 thiamine pyrophosphate-dependent acetolactate synthase large subunit-like protein [Actinoplanes lutulentus]RAK42887.1 thiamine pyrophosphate-dependent acetolactate synthase large subunit-like protein [Actinoplanes lutulentus]